MSHPTFDGDFEKILEQLEKEEVFTKKESRSLESYNSQPLMSHIKWANIKEWIKEKIKNLDVY